MIASGNITHLISMKFSQALIDYLFMLKDPPASAERAFKCDGAFGELFCNSNITKHPCFIRFSLPKLCIIELRLEPPHPEIFRLELSLSRLEASLTRVWLELARAWTRLEPARVWLGSSLWHSSRRLTFINEQSVPFSVLLKSPPIRFQRTHQTLNNKDNKNPRDLPTIYGPAPKRKVLTYFSFKRRVGTLANQCA